MSSDPTTGRAKELFLDALEREPEERARWIAELEDGSPELAARVRALLAAHEGAAQAGLERVSELARELRSRVQEASVGLAPGERVGDYELLDELGAGGGGVVYRARQVSLGRIVAVKLLAGGRLATEPAVRRFRAEAEAAARLEHPHIVPVYEVGVHEGRPFFSMRWIEGGNLAQHVERYSPRAAARLLATIAHAVHHGHQRGILHRDLKPSNILLDLHGAPHVADFGVAKRIDVESSATATAGLQGTPAYMAPEQVAGRAGELTVATDVWALGCVLYELLAGRRAFAGESFTEILLAVREREPAPLRKLAPRTPRDLETICQRALAKEPARRYASALAFAEDLERFLDHHPILARRARLPERLALAWRRHPWTGSLAAAVALLVLALAIGMSWLSFQINASLERTRAAQEEGRELLRTSLFEQARARRVNRIPGRRHESLALLARAAEIRPGPDLRDEAIACLALTDLVPERSWPMPEGAVPYVCFDPALARAAIPREDGTVLVIELASGAQRVLAARGGVPWRERYSPDGRLLLVHYTAAQPGGGPAFRVWDVERGETVLESTWRARVTGECFHPDGERVFVLAEDGTGVREFELASGAHRELALPAAGTRALALRPDGNALAFAPCGEAAAGVIELERGELVASLDLDEVEAWCLEWDRAGARLYVGTPDRRALAWDVAGGALAGSYAGHQAEVVDLCLSEREGVLVTHAWDGMLRLFDLASHELELALAAVPHGFDPSGTRLGYSTAAEFGVLEVATGDFLEVVRAHEEVGMFSVAVSPDGRVLASAADDGVVLWDLAGRERLGWITAIDGKEVLFQPGGRRIFAATEEGFYAWEYGDGALDPDALAAEELLAGTCNRAAISADGRVVAVGTWDAGAPEGTRVHVWWLDASRAPLALDAFQHADQLSLSRDGRFLAAGNWGGRNTWVWDLESGARVLDFARGPSAHFPRFDPSGDRLLVATTEGLWSFATDTWEAHHVLARDVQTDRTSPLAFSQDGRTLAYGLEGSIVELRDATTLALRATLTPPEVHPTTSIAFGPDGRALYLATSNRTTLAWDLAGLERELARRGLAVPPAE